MAPLLLKAAEKSAISSNNRRKEYSMWDYKFIGFLQRMRWPTFWVALATCAIGIFLIAVVGVNPDWVFPVTLVAGLLALFCLFGPYAVLLIP